MIRCASIIALCAVLLISDMGAAGAFTLRELPDLDYNAIASEGAASAGFYPSGGEDGYVSTKKAVLYSLLLPGLGHRYMGRKKTAASFFLIDVAIWTSFVVFQVQADQRQEGYETFAQQFAGVLSTGHSDDYYALLTQFNTSGDYESQIKSEGRAEFFPGGSAQQLEEYWLENRIGDFEAWLWSSEENRRAYQNQRSASKSSERRALYSVALAVANRVTASFFALKAARDINSAVEESQSGFRIELGAPVHAASDIDTGLSIVRKF